VEELHGDPRSGPEVKNGRSSAKDGAPERLRCRIIQKEVSQIMQKVSAGAARRRDNYLEGSDYPVAPNGLRPEVVELVIKRLSKEFNVKSYNLAKKTRLTQYSCYES